MADGSAWCGRLPVTQDIQRGSIPLSVAINKVIAVKTERKETKRNESWTGLRSPHLHQEHIRNSVLLLGMKWFRQGKEYRSRQHGNVEAVRVRRTWPKKQNK